MTSDIKLLSINMQGAKPYNYTSSVVKTISKCASKWISLIHYARDNNYSIILAQETKSNNPGDIYQYIKSAFHDDPNFHVQVYESVNTHNPNKGGVAIISINKEIDLQPTDVDYGHPNWQNTMS